MQLWAQLLYTAPCCQQCVSRSGSEPVTAAWGEDQARILPHGMWGVGFCSGVAALCPRETSSLGHSLPKDAVGDNYFFCSTIFLSLGPVNEYTAGWVLNWTTCENYLTESTPSTVPDAALACLAFRHFLSLRRFSTLAKTSSTGCSNISEGLCKHRYCWAISSSAKPMARLPPAFLAIWHPKGDGCWQLSSCRMLPSTYHAHPAIIYPRLPLHFGGRAPVSMGVDFCFPCHLEGRCFHKEHGAAPLHFRIFYYFYYYSVGSRAMECFHLLSFLSECNSDINNEKLAGSGRPVMSRGKDSRSDLSLELLDRFIALLETAKSNCNGVSDWAWPWYENTSADVK